MNRKSAATQKSKTSAEPVKQPPLTFMDHVSELRNRLFWVAVWFIITSGAVLPFFDTVIKLLMRPLGNEKLYYLTPIGGLGFMIKVSLYLGAIATMPVLIYHLYKFISPVVRKHSARKGITYITLSFILALIGITFAYIVSLPSAIHFLTHVDIAGVSPMLTVDSYLSFIIAYLIAGALLFQLPLVMTIIDSIRPTPPGQWIKYERHMIVGAFIVAMLVTPTPNVIDQVILAVPIIVMYQLGIGLIYIRHKSRRRHAAKKMKQDVVSTVELKYENEPVVKKSTAQVVTIQPTTSRKVMDMTMRPHQLQQAPLVQQVIRPSVPRHAPPKLQVPAPRTHSVGMPRSLITRSIDGISVI